MAAPEYMNDLLKSFGVYSWLQLVDLVCRHNMYMIPSFLIERKNLQNLICEWSNVLVSL